VLLSSGIVAAPEKKAIEPPPLPPDPEILSAPQDSDEDVLIYWNDEEEEGPDMAWFGTGPNVMYFSEPEAGDAPMHHYSAGRRVVMRGEDRPWLGVILSDLDSEQAKSRKLAGENGVLVKEVREGSPAAKAGLMKDDVIVEFAGEKVRSAAHLRRLVRETPVGRSVTMVVNRAGKTQSLTAQLEARHEGPMMGLGRIPAGPEPFTMPLPLPTPGRKFEFFVQHGARLGISADDLTPQLADFFGVKQGKGVLVREVIVGSAAEKAGLRAGDVIVALDGQEISSVGKLRRALAGDKSAEKRKVTLTIVRDKREQSVSVELESPDKAGPKPAMRAEIELDTKWIQEIADEAAARAKEIGLAWRERARTFQTEWQSRLQQEMEKLQKELPKLQEEIEKQKAGLKAHLQRI
jgi:membrane-associated protease RseP (regulator of RpoE activity)